MALRALRFTADSDTIIPIRVELSDDTIRSAARLKLQVPPTVYVILDKDLNALRFKELIVDRGKKHHAKPLAKLLLGFAKIPLIDGGYESPGQLVRSIRALLENAFKRDDHNIYIVGTAEAILNELWERAGKSDNELIGLHSSKKRIKSATSSSEVSSGALLDLLPHREVPKDFVHSYVGSSADIQLVRQLALRAAASDDPVLILGDTGTGKEVIARSIHKYSARASEKFVPVNCGAIPGELLESELFGHKRYVFTDAKYDKKGLWEMTGNGTLFLDEVGDLAPAHQVKILRALEDSRIRPIGESKEIKVNARVIAATNRDLFAMVKAKQFREDLYYRLRTFLIRTPRLRNHPEDIPVLARFFWRKITRDESAVLPEDVSAAIASYGWPGNARELRSVLMSLYTLFGMENLDVTRLNAIFQIQGQSAIEPRSAEEVILHRVDCLRHLRRVDEVLRAIVVSARPLVQSRQSKNASAESVRSALRRRLGELEELFLRPMLFHNKVTFKIVDGLRERMSYFYGLLEGDSRIAASYWKNEVTSDLELALTAIFQEAERLESNV